MNTTETSIRRIYNDILNGLYAYKIRYALYGGLLVGAFTRLEDYGYALNIEAFNIFFDVIGEKLSESDDIEYEWPTDEYDKMMEIKKLI